MPGIIIYIRNGENKCLKPRSSKNRLKTAYKFWLPVRKTYIHTCIYRGGIIKNFSDRFRYKYQIFSFKIKLDLFNI